LLVRKKAEKAYVEDIQIEDYTGKVMRTESYYRYLTTMQLNKMAEYSGRIIKKQDETIGNELFKVSVIRISGGSVIEKVYKHEVSA